MADLGVCYLWAKIKIMDFGNFQTILILLASFFIFRDSLTRKNLDIIVAVENCVQFQQINLGKHMKYYYIFPLQKYNRN